MPERRSKLLGGSLLALLDLTAIDHDVVHVAHEPIHVGAAAVRAVDDGGLVIGDRLRQLECLLAVTAVEFVDRHGILHVQT
jgi:hypothetical protein